MPPLKLGDGENRERMKKIPLKILNSFRDSSSPQKPISFYLKIISRNVNAVLKFSYYLRDYEKMEAPWR